ncbi:MAG: hypothetical protein Q4E13_10410 [Clostridia bacterium]|nr:hypothetical protein [Clostridia bacterium]
MTPDSHNNALSVLTPEQMQAIPTLIQQMMGPIVDAMGKLLEHNAEALDQLAGAQKVQNDRLEALEKQIRLNTLVTPQQVRYMNDAIRARARDLLFKRGIEDAKAVKKLGNAIRKSVLARYGISALHEIPKHEYSVAMNQIGMWSDALQVRDAVKEARERAEQMAMAEVEQPARVDGASADARQNDQPNQCALRAPAEGLNDESES